MKITRQSVKALVRKKVTSYTTIGKCMQCHRELYRMYYVWESSKTGDKFCTFCYAEAVRDTEHDLRGAHVGRSNRVKSVDPNLYNSIGSLGCDTGMDVEQDVKLRLEMHGPMMICSKCSKACKVPMSKNAKFFCADYDGPLNP